MVGLGWAVLPENGTSVNGLPRVERSLDWIRLAARFPVRIKVENPDDSFRIGASAVATVQRHPARGQPVTPSALLDFLRRELAPTPGRGSATFRLTLACLAATIPILTHHIPHGLMVMIVMYLITQEDTAATLIGSILGVIGVTIGLGLALLAWRISLDIAWLRLCFFVAFLFGGLFLKRVLTIGALGSAIGLPAALVMILPDILPPSPEVLVEFVLWIWWCVTLGLSVNRRRAAPAVAGRPSDAAATGAGHAA